MQAEKSRKDKDMGARASNVLQASIGENGGGGGDILAYAGPTVSFLFMLAVLVLFFPAGSKSHAPDGTEWAFLRILALLVLHCISSYQSCILPSLSIEMAP